LAMVDPSVTNLTPASRRESTALPDLGLDPPITGSS